MDFKYSNDLVPNIINISLILKTIDTNKTGDKDRNDDLTQEELLECVKDLRLEFLSIIRIDCLWLLPGLTKLSLSNNRIEKIENIDALVNLEDLDLSFNEIKIIENLEELSKLKVLSLYSNQISDIRNLDYLTQLIVLSIGRNNIRETECVLHLRKLKNLRSLNLSENKFAHDINFRLYIVAVLPQITYYGYKRVTQEERNEGIELFKLHLKKVTDKEIIEQKKQAAEQLKQKQKEHYLNCFVEFFDEREFFHTFFDNDPDGRTLLSIKEIQQMYLQFENEFQEIANKFLEFGLEQFEIRKKEIDDFFQCVDNAKSKNVKQSQEIMEVFMEEKRQITTEIKCLQNPARTENEPITEIEDINKKVADFSEKQARQNDLSELFHSLAQRTWKKLMSSEMHLFDRSEDINMRFEENLIALIDAFCEKSKLFFDEFRMVEKTYKEEVLAKIMFLSSMDNEEEKNKIQNLYDDAELLENVVDSSHDIHNQLIDVRQTRLFSRTKEWLQKFTNNIHRSEIRRNRTTVLEINHFLDIQKEEFEDLFQCLPVFDDDVSSALLN